jgi:hypothetical protein
VQDWQKNEVWLSHVAEVGFLSAFLGGELPPRLSES